jgi:hypothetical protein
MIYWVTWIKFLNTGAFTTKLIRFLTVLLFKHHILLHFEPKIVRSHCALDIAKLAVPFHPILILRQSFARLNRCIIQLLWKWSRIKTKSDLRLKKCIKLTVNNEMLRLDFNHGHDLVQIEKLNGRGTAFPEVYVFKLGCQFGALWQKFGRKMTSLGTITTKLVAKLSPL